LGGHCPSLSLLAALFVPKLSLGTKSKISTFKFGYSIEQLLDYLGMQNLSYMERDNDPRTFFQINFMTAFATQQHKASPE